MTDKDIQEYFNTEHGKSVKDFIEQDRQDAIVYSVVTDGRTRYVHCWSPVWKTIYLSDSLSSTTEEIQRGDIITLSRRKIFAWDKDFIYSIRENKTTEQIKQKGLEKILKKFDDAQRHNILCISEFQRLNKLK